MKQKKCIPESVIYHRAAGSLHPDPCEFLFQEVAARKAAAGVRVVATARRIPVSARILLLVLIIFFLKSIGG